MDWCNAFDASIQSLFTKICNSQTSTLNAISVQHTKAILDHIDEMRKENAENRSRRDLQQRKHRFLDSLLHGNPFTRANDILTRYDGTFDWIFDEGTGSPFPTWLQSDDGIFWVQGKPGAGKSTLMKFICTSVYRIEQFLMQAIPGKSPVMFSFYFWLADSAKMQNTEKGFLCSLLSQLLESNWLLDSSYLEDAKLRQKQTQANWDLHELRLLSLRVVEMLIKERSVCILVDALDECQPDDLPGVLQIIKQLSEYGVRLCVSSRPEPQILRRLEPIVTGILRIESHTKGDIAKFVTEEFQSVDRDAGLLRSGELFQLQQLIINHADGVFLWATLAAKDLLRGIVNGDNFHQLYDRVQRFPADLNALYRNMLDRLGPDQCHYMAEAAAYLSMALYCKDHPPVFLWPTERSLPLLHYIWVYKKLFHRNLVPHEQSLCTLLPRVESRINAVCAGMLITLQSQMVDPSSKESPCYRVTRFVHRTARDFLLDSGSDIMRGRWLSVNDFYSATTSGYLMACRLDAIPRTYAGYHSNRAIERLTQSQLTQQEKVTLLVHLDISLQQIYKTKFWSYRQWVDDHKPRYQQIKNLDLLGATIRYAPDSSFLDHILDGDSSMGTRYKSYLLFLACSKVEMYGTSIKRLLAMGANPNSTFHPSLADPWEHELFTDYVTKSTPWIQFLVDASSPYRKVDIGLLRAFLENGADLNESTLWCVSVNPRTGDLAFGWGILPRIRDVELILHANARYCLEIFLGISVEDVCLDIKTSHPVAYGKAIGLFSELDFPLTRSSPEVAYDTMHYFEIFGSLISHIHIPVIREQLVLPGAPQCLYKRNTPPRPENSCFLQSSLQRVMEYIQQFFSPPRPVDDLDRVLNQLNTYWRYAKIVRVLDYAQDNGYLMHNSDPASLFPDYEDFRAENGTIDLDLLFET